MFFFQPFLFFAPTVDGRVITDAPADLIKSGKVHRMPLMIGCTNSEGTGMLPMRATPGYNEGLKEEAVKNIFIDTFQKIYQVPYFSVYLCSLKLFDSGSLSIFY